MFVNNHSTFFLSGLRIFIRFLCHYVNSERNEVVDTKSLMVSNGISFRFLVLTYFGQSFEQRFSTNSLPVIRNKLNTLRVFVCFGFKLTLDVQHVINYWVHAGSPQNLITLCNIFLSIVLRYGGIGLESEN